MKKSILTLFIAVACTFASQAQEKKLFKLKPEIGKTIKYDLNMLTDIEGDANLVMDMKFKMNMLAKSANDSIINFESNYDHLLVNMDMGLIAMNYDSSKEPQDEFQKAMSSQLKPILENSMLMSTTHSGKVVDFSFANVPTQMFDKSAMDNFSINFPDKAIAVGESWSFEKDLAQLSAKAKYTITFTEETAEGYKFNTIADILDAQGNVIGNASGTSIADKKTLMTNYSNAETTIEFMGNKVQSKVEFKQAN